MTNGGEPLALVVDLGTGGPKIGLATVRGELVWSEHRAVETRQDGEGGAVQDPGSWWEAILDASRRGLARVAGGGASVAAVCCTGQYASTVPVDEDGAAVGDCLLWMDSRGGPHSRAAVGGPVSGYSPLALVRWVRRSGGAPSTFGADPIGHMLFLDHECPEIATRARWYLEPIDYLTLCFTGVAAATHASMLAAWLTDNRHSERLAYDPVLVRASGVDAAKLPPLLPTGAVVGPVRPEVTALLGLRPDVPVVAAVPDLHSAAVGAGAVADYEAHLALSTSSWISCPVPFKRTDALRQIASVPGLGPGRYLVVDNHETGGACLQWLRDALEAPLEAVPLETVPPETVPLDTAPLEDAPQRGAEPAPGRAPVAYEALTALAAGAPVGAGGVVFTPWLAGERSPVDDRRARGGFHNMSLRTTRAELVRAVLEGVAYNSRWLHQAVERFAGRRLDPLRVLGGGAASALWCQIHADVLDRTVVQIADPVRANLRGAALFAWMALGQLDVSELRSLVAVGGTFTPEPAHRARYDALYAEFPRLYRAQRAMFHRLNPAS